jgi:phage terminase small subunit
MSHGAKLDGLTVRERALVAGVAAGKSQTAAAREAGVPAKSAPKTGSEMLSRPQVRERFRELLADAGLDDASLVGELRRLLNTKRYGTTMQGQVVELGDDGATQVKALDMAMRIADAYPNPKLDVDMRVQGAVLIGTADDLRAILDGPRDVSPD